MSLRARAAAPIGGLGQALLYYIRVSIAVRARARGVVGIRVRVRIS